MDKQNHNYITGMWNSVSDGKLPPKKVRIVFKTMDDRIHLGELIDVDYVGELFYEHYKGYGCEYLKSEVNKFFVIPEDTQ